MGFQKTVNNDQAPAVAGDFASTNPFASVLAGPGALVAPEGGLIVGNFAWVGPQGQVSQSYVAGYQVGFLGRNEQALITEFLGEATMVVPEGFMVTLFNEGDFWAEFEGGATVGNAVYADPNNGAPLSGNVASSGTGSAGFTGTGTVVNASTTLTVNTVTAGILSAGDTVAGTDIPVGTTIVEQLTGTPGGVGTYEMSAAATAGAGPEAITATSQYVLMTAVSAGAFTDEDVISGTNVTAGTKITGQAVPFAGVANTTNASTALVVTEVQPGTDLLRVGAKVVALGVPAGTTISAQTAGTPGGAGTYTLSAAATATQNGVAVTTNDAPGGTGLYSVSVAQQFASTTVSVAGSAVATGFNVRGVYSPSAAGAGSGGQLAKISTR